jgi:predicted nucleotidyltransferase
VGLAEPLRAALAPLAYRIRAAFVYGSVAKREDTASSDVDLMIVSDEVGYPELFSALEPLQVRLRRTVNPQVYSSAELSKKISEKNSFVVRVLAQPKIWIFGDEDEIAA